MLRRVLLVIVVLGLIFSLATIGYIDENVAAENGREPVLFKSDAPLENGKDTRILIEVYDDSYIKEKDSKEIVNLFVLHEDESSYEEVFKGVPSSTFSGAGAYVERAQISIQNVGSKWIGFVTISPKKSISKLVVCPEESFEGNNFVVLDLKAQEEEKKGKIRRLANGNPNLNEVVEVINTPKELLLFMNEYFRIKYHDGHVAFSPKEFFEKRHGDCKDWSVFAGYVLDKNGYKVKQLAYNPEGSKSNHVVEIFWEDGDLYYLTIRRNDAKIYGPFDKLEEVFDSERDRRSDLRNEKIKCYIIEGPTVRSIDDPCLFKD